MIKLNDTINLTVDYQNATYNFTFTGDVLNKTINSKTRLGKAFKLYQKTFTKNHRPTIVCNNGVILYPEKLKDNIVFTQEELHDICRTAQHQLIDDGGVSLID